MKTKTITIEKPGHVSDDDFRKQFDILCHQDGAIAFTLNVVGGKAALFAVHQSALTRYDAVLFASETDDPLLLCGEALGADWGHASDSDHDTIFRPKGDFPRVPSGWRWRLAILTSHRCDEMAAFIKALDECGHFVLTTYSSEGV